MDRVVGQCCGDTDITFLLGNRDGTFQPEVNIDFGSAIKSVVADFNVDGKQDIAGGATADALIFLNQPPAEPAAGHFRAFGHRSRHDDS